MSEPTALLPPEPPPPQPPPPPPRQAFPWLTAGGFLALAIGLVLVWQFPATPPASNDRADELARQLGTLEARVARLEQRPQPQAPDLGPLTARIAALEQRPPSASDLQPLAARVAALEQRTAPAPTGTGSAPDLGSLASRVSALEQRPVPQPPSPAPDLGPLTGRIAVLEQRKVPDLAPLEGKVTALEAAERAAQSDQARRLDVTEKRVGRMAQVQAAATALAAGQKLGDLPGAPPMLARFANSAPPTEAALRLAFPNAAREALAAAHPATEGKPLLARLWSQAQELVTIRQGSQVLVGDPTAGVLEQARAALEAGDLAGATANVASLQGAPAQAMAPWLAEARALLEARVALAAWAAGG